MSEGTLDCIVVGGGVVGLAVARELALAGREVIVLEKNTGIGEETSSRNSEVIHAGIYYPTGSLKARLCVSGKEALYVYCRDKGVPHSRCGKIIVAIDAAQTGRLDALRGLGKANGVDDLEWLDAPMLRRLEPAVVGAAGLWSPSTGIIDSHALMVALQGDLEAAGGMLTLKSEVTDVLVGTDGLRVTVQNDSERVAVRARTLVNAAGLHATQLASSCRGVAGFTVPSTRYAKGSYFTYAGASPFTHLLYPLPVDGGLGVHVTLDLVGRIRFGPDVEWCDELDYSVDASRAPAFYEAIRDYWPEVELERLVPAYSGIRPKLNGPGEPPADFRIDAPVLMREAHLVHLFGMESPGLTASLAIAKHVRELLEDA